MSKLFVSFLGLLFLFPAFSAGAQQSVRLGGYLQTWLMVDEHVASEVEERDTWGFRVRRARLTVQADLADRFTVVSWYEFSGAQRNLLDFFVNADLSSYVRITAGQFRPAAQMYDTGILASSRLIFYERPTISTRMSSIMGYDAFRDIGVQLGGLIGPVRYAFNVGNGMGRFIQAGSNVSARNLGGGLYGARVDLTPSEGLIVGGHFALNRQNNVVRDGLSTYDIDRTSYSLRIATNNLGIPQIFTELEAGGGSVNDYAEFDFSGLYLQAGYRLNPTWTILARYDAYREDAPQGLMVEEHNFTVGFIYFWRYGGEEVVRLGMNLATGTSEPGGIRRNVVVVWFQIRFMS